MMNAECGMIQTIYPHSTFSIPHSAFCNTEVAMNGRPLSMRKKVQIMVALTLLAWATQTLLHQWAHAAEAPQQRVLDSATDANTPASIDTGTGEALASPTREPIFAS